MSDDDAPAGHDAGSGAMMQPMTQPAWEVLSQGLPHSTYHTMAPIGIFAGARRTKQLAR